MGEGGFEALLQELARESAAGTMRSARDGQAAGGVEAALDGIPSNTPISSAAVDLLVASEVSSRAFYEARLTHPVRPPGNSGVTIGIGYDVGTVDATRLQRDWAAELPGSALSRLQRACGVLGPRADSLVPGLSDITVGYDQAERVFSQRSVPLAVGETERALPNTGLLGPDCLGALVSLTYNRGPSFQAAGDRFREMRSIRQHMEDRAFALIPGELRSMKRIWQGDPSLRGVVLRREAEAVLFERGLAHGAASGATEAVVADADPHTDPDDPASAGAPGTESAGTEAALPWRVAKALLVLRQQVDQAAPQRNKASDGTIADGAHAARTSDHNPWIVDGGMGVVTAMDLTHDPAGGCDAGALAEALRGARDPRVKYVIWNRRIFSATVAPWQWRPYDGANPHDHHVHISVATDKARYDLAEEWHIAPVMA